MLQNALRGSFRIFRLFGITVYLHWAWLILAVYEFQTHRGYTSPVWNLLEYIAIFGIVTMHEFGHALACRSVGGRANTIVLWPLGGVAFVQPPQRPGPILWSIAAGPLVNVVLAPIFLVAAGMFSSFASDAVLSDPQRFLSHIAVINLIILGFNLLPIYPLDGGQILQALLWFVLGRARSLKIVAVIGLIAAAVGVVFALRFHEPFMVLMAVFIGWQSFNGYRIALLMAEEDRRLREVIESKYTGPRGDV